jgi:hypothetical protein
VALIVTGNPVTSAKLVLVEVTSDVRHFVVGLPVTDDHATEPALGVAQDPSPRQKVDALALVPLLRLVTGRLPVTPVLNGSPVQFVNVPLDGVPKAPPLVR